MVYSPVRRTVKPRGLLLLSHGAGRGIDSTDLQALADELPTLGWAVALFEQPWRVAGRRVASAPATLDDGLRAVASELIGIDTLGAGLPLIVGGRSAGARSAARCAVELGARGVLAVSFPLHPPGRPDRSRLTELTEVSVPILVIQGARDSLGRPEEFPDPWPSAAQLVVVPDADHELKVPRSSSLSQSEVHRLVVDAAVRWLARVASDVENTG
ncbi:MAG: alpha/beta hydrolase family protein [Nocardioides sp.]